jgi:hypothetical protein
MMRWWTSTMLFPTIMSRDEKEKENPFGFHFLHSRYQENYHERYYYNSVQWF